MEKTEEFQANNNYKKGTKTDGMEISFYFCDEIEEEIMLRLPIKSLSRFNCVSKRWYTRITSSEFAQKHLKRQRQAQANNFNLMLHGNVGPLKSVRSSNIYSDKDAEAIPYRHNQPLLLDLKYYTFHVVGSCDGLLLVLATSTDIGDCVDYVVYIWNPTTGKYKILPKLLSYMHCYTVFGFGPDLTTTDNNNNHYKVLLLEFVRGRACADIPINNFYMYTTHTNSWKPLLQNIGPNGYFCPQPKGMILAYNKLHYVVGVTTVDILFKKSVISFGLKDDMFRVLPILDPFQTLIEVCALNGDLCAFSKSYGGDDGNFFHLWRMENFGVKNEECWTKICSIDVRSAMDKPITIISPLHILEDGQILLYVDSSYPDHDKTFIVSYHIENEKASFLVQCNMPFFCIPVVYEESFISQNAASTVEEELPRQLIRRRTTMDS